MNSTTYLIMPEEISKKIIYRNVLTKHCRKKGRRKRKKEGREK